MISGHNPHPVGMLSVSVRDFLVGPKKAGSLALVLRESETSMFLVSGRSVLNFTRAFVSLNFNSQLLVLAVIRLKF